MTPEEAAARLDRLARASSKAVEKGEKLSTRHFDEIAREPFSWEVLDLVDAVTQEAARYDAVTRYVPMSFDQATRAHEQRTGGAHPTMWKGGDPEGAGTAWPDNDPDTLAYRGEGKTVGEEQAEARRAVIRANQKTAASQQEYHEAVRAESQRMRDAAARDAQAMARRHVTQESTVDARHHGGFFSGLFSALSGGGASGSWVDAEAERMRQRAEDRRSGGGPSSGRWIDGTWHDD